MMATNDDGKEAAASSSLLLHATQGEENKEEDKDNLANETSAAAKEETTSLSPSTSSTPSARRRRRKSSGSSKQDKENDDNVTAAAAAAARTTTPSKSRNRSSSSNWGSWRDISSSPSKSSSSRRSKGIPPKAFHGVVAAHARGGAPPYPPLAATTTSHRSSKDTTSRNTTATEGDKKSNHKQGGAPSTTTQKSGQEKVLELHQTVQSNLVKQGKKQVLEEQKVKRSAFKQVTSLQTWPLQDRALRHYQQLMDQHLHISRSSSSEARSGPNTIDKEAVDQKDTQKHKADESPTAAAAAGLATPTTADTTIGTAPQSSASASSSSSSSSSSSVFSADNEPKRLLRDLRWSPTKSRLKFQLQQEFLREQALEQGTASDDDKFGPALWCMEPRVFSIEKSATGKRKYVVGHAGRFFDAYWRKSNRSHRHYYELILQDTPIRLYLDLEFHKASNPDITPALAEVFLEQLLDNLARQLQQSFPDQFGGKEFELNKSHVVDLDSSTDKKFSRHWIVHLPGGYLFANTTALGRFMHAWVGDILTAAQQQHQQQGDDDDDSNSSAVLFQHLFVNAPPSKAATTSAASSGTNNNSKTCLIDLGVYTRNRLFRLMGSTKFGKPPSAALRIADTNEFPFPDGFGNESFYLPAMSLEQQEQHLSSQESSQDSVEVVVEKFATAVDWTAHAEALAQTLVVPLNSSKIDYPILPFDADHESNKLSSNTINTTRPKSSIVSSSSSSSSSLWFGRSPFPMIDDFVLHTLATRGGIQGSIRAWSVEYDAETHTHPAYVTYQMSRNRWCENVQRAHKSNNIVWRVDLVLMRAVQTCHDPECRALQFRGTPVPLPDAVQEQVYEQLRLLSNEASSSTDNHNANKKKGDCDDDFADFDDESFERALAAMNLDEIESRFTAARDIKNNTGDAVAAALQEQASAQEPDKKSTGDDDDDNFDDFSDDDALVQAMLTNPELFP